MVRKNIATWLRFALLCVSAGCTTHTTVVRPLTPDKEAEFNEIVAGRNGEITVEGKPENLTIKNVRLAGSGVHFRELGASEQLPDAEVPFASVQRIEFREHGRGALHGLGIGAGIGAVGAGIASVVYLSNCRIGDCYPGLAAAGVALATVCVGLLGTALGAAIGAPRIIDFMEAPPR
jgi:hypothetical protein